MQAFVIGDRDMVTGFQLVGVRGVEVSSVEEAWHVLSKAVENVEVGIIIISEEFSTKMRDKIDTLRLSRATPLIVEIPGRLGPSKAIDLSDLVRKAIGVEV
ncbi:V-type ATP synthase subunit F [Candidatus Bathyarchaeota archaeon]|nr:V-type ATP synthase subunit F [Candidatus Bathyarchaeota archaeon]